MIVLDASAAIDLLIGNDPASGWVNQQLQQDRHAAAPHLIDIEVASGLRRLRAAEAITETIAKIALTELPNLGLDRYPHLDFLGRVWQLRPVLTAYDAIYVALAEALDATLVTTDGGVAGAPGVQVPIAYFER